MALQPFGLTSAYLKMGLLGAAGAGKTYTAAQVAIGLVQYMQQRGIDYAKKPVAMLDTETGSHWLVPLFEKAGIPFVGRQSRRFADLLAIMDEAEQEASVLIIDSITHPWRELCDSYMKKKQRTYLQIDDYTYLKGPYGFGQYNHRYINSNLHIIEAGRAGDIFDNWTDEDGKRHLEKVGTKMRVESEAAFEPSLLVLMERVENMRKHTVVNRATVQKDRSTLLNGLSFDNPTFEDFLPHIERLALGSDHVGVVANGDSQDILKVEKRDWSPIQRKIALGEIRDLLVMHIPGQAAADKQRKITLLRKHFNACWEEIEDTMSLPDLRANYDSLHQELEGKPSRYAQPAPAPLRIVGAVIDNKPKPSLAEVLNDQIPMFEEAPVDDGQLMLAGM